MRPFGLCLIVVSVLIPGFWFFGLAAQFPNAAIFAQYIGVIALIIMAISQLMATRFGFVEHIFGPMDKTYQLHKWLGIAAVVTMLLHDNVGAEIKNLGPKGAWSDLGENLGEIGQNGILILIAVSLALFIPYHWWKLTHKFIGAFFVLSALHFVMVDKPFSLFDPLGLYTLVFCILGVVSYAITLMPLRLRKSYHYSLKSVVDDSAATVITLVPDGKPMRHKAGQFAFISFVQDGLDEMHPFTLSAAPTESGELRISIKPLGKFTNRIGRDLKVGTPVSVQGPFGRFGASRGKTPQIWIAAGIGVTPFTALLGDWREEDPAIEIYYTFRGQANAAHLTEIEEYVAALPNVTFHQVDTTGAARLNPEFIADQTRFDLRKAKVLYCGPKSLRQSLFVGLKPRGLTSRRFHYEEFEIRSDFWPLDRINDPAKAWIAKFGV